MHQVTNITQILIDTINSLAQQFINFVPRIIGFLVILGIGYLAAKAIYILIKNVLGKVGFDRIGERINDIGFIKQLKTEVKLSEIVAKAVYYFIILVFLTAATEALGIQAVTSMVMSLVNFIPKIIAAAIMLQVGILVSDSIKQAVVILCKSFNIPSSKLIGNLVFIFFIVITFISALAQIGINTTLLESSFIIIIGGIMSAFALGYGIASKDVIANMLASIYSRNKYREGQLVQIDGVKGTIIRVDNISVTLQTQDAVVIVPLQHFQSKKVEIFTE
jgi:small-conductance mechanosensitive channel